MTRGAIIAICLVVVGCQHRPAPSAPEPIYVEPTPLGALARYYLASIATPVPGKSWLLVYAPMVANADGTYAVHRNVPIERWPVALSYVTRPMCELAIWGLQGSNQTPGTVGFAIQQGEAKCVTAVPGVAAVRRGRGPGEPASSAPY